MADGKARLGTGNVLLTLAGKEYTMVPTLAAAQGVSRLSGGIRGGIDAVIRLDIDTIVRVVQLGLGPTVVREIGPSLPELIFQEGLTDSGGEVVSKCVEYMTLLSNGGRPLTPIPDEGAGSPSL
jgi:hypothetical protein